MSRLQQRVTSLEGMAAPFEGGPEIIFLVGVEKDADGNLGGEASGAILVNCQPDNLSREDGETEVAFMDRASATLADWKRAQAAQGERE